MLDKEKEIKMKDRSSTRFFFSFSEQLEQPSASPYTTETDADTDSTNNTVMTMTNQQQQEEEPQEQEQQEEESDENTIYHTVEPSDSLRWICLKYNVTAPAIRAANNDFIGNNLKFAPARLRIPSATATTTVITTSGTDGVGRSLINPRRRRTRRAGGLMKMKKRMLSSSSVDKKGTTCHVAPEKKIGNVDNNFFRFRGNDLVYAPDHRCAIPVTVTIPKSTIESELNNAHDDEKVESLESQVSKITL